MAAFIIASPMSIVKAMKAKNSGDFIELLQQAYINEAPEKVLAALLKPPAMKWGADTRIAKEGMISWCKGSVSDGLIMEIKKAPENSDFRAAIIGCLYLFGLGESTKAIAASESIFEVVENSSEYPFHATTMLSELIGGSIEWSGAEGGKYYVGIEINYLKSTVISVVDDLRAMDKLYEEATIIDCSKGLARAGDIAGANKLLMTYADQIVEFDQIFSLASQLSSFVSGIIAEKRSTTAPSIPFVSQDTFAACSKVAKALAGSERKEDLDQIVDYIKSA